MPAFVPEFRERRGGSFQLIASAFLGDSGLPFAHILSADRIRRVFAKTRRVVWVQWRLFDRHGPVGLSQSGVAGR